MARGLLCVILAVCLIYVSQASPVPDQNPAPTTEPINWLTELERTVNVAIEAGKKGFEAITNDPGVQKIVEDTKNNFQIGIDTMNQKLRELIPKTNQ